MAADFEMNNENPYSSPMFDNNGPMFDGDAVIRVTRTTGYPDRLRAYRIVLDGYEMARVNAGQFVEFPVFSGMHSIVAKVDWCSSPTLNRSVRKGETVQFECGSNLRGLRFIFVFVYAFFLRNQYLTLIQV
jgi:hypothetical protein